MSAKVRWGVLGAAKIATVKVIPAMQLGEWSTVTAIASRTIDKARAAASDLGIATAYGSYEALLADPSIEAVYNPLPNHLHVDWSIRAAEAGKHVLCEKPLGMSAQDALRLVAVRDRTGVKMGDGFMVRTHPQWLRTRELVRSGEIGELRAVHTHFSYSNRDPQNIRNIAEYGGGALMDIGCYAIQFARFLFEAEPVRVAAVMDRDPDSGTDRLSSAMLEFPNGQATFTCSTQLVNGQRVHVHGTKGRIEVAVPVNAPPDRATRIAIDTGADLFGSSARFEDFPAVNQYTIQGDLFSQAVRNGSEVPSPLEDGIANMAVIDAVVLAAHSGRWEPVETRL